MADAIDRPDEVTISDSVSRLFQLPQILRKPGDRCRRIENNFRSIQAKHTCPLGEVAVVTNINPDTSEGGVESWITEITRTEIEPLPEPGVHMGNMILA